MPRWRPIWILILVILVPLGACQESQPDQQLVQEPRGELSVESSAFQHGNIIPQRYTCDGEDASPPLSWSEPPPGTAGLVLVVDDPDAPAGTWVHWVLFNIPVETRGLEDGVPALQQVESVGVQGHNGWGNLGYGGPCPPPGAPHRYHFKLYALDTTLELDAGASKGDVEKAMAGHILAEGQLIGQYGR